MASTELMSVEEARAVLSTRFKRAREAELHTIVTKHGEPDGVLVDFAWYKKAREALGEPTEVAFTPRPVRPRRRRPATKPE